MDNGVKQIWSLYPSQVKKAAALGCASAMLCVASPPYMMATAGITVYRWNKILEIIKK